MNELILALVLVSGGLIALALWLMWELWKDLRE